MIKTINFIICPDCSKPVTSFVTENNENLVLRCTRCMYSDLLISNSVTLAFYKNKILSEQNSKRYISGLKLDKRIFNENR